VVQWALANHSIGFFAFSNTNPAVWAGEAMVGVAACIAAARVSSESGH
jgi:hypothetical protein